MKYGRIGDEFLENVERFLMLCVPPERDFISCELGKRSCNEGIILDPDSNGSTKS